MKKGYTAVKKIPKPKVKIREIILQGPDFKLQFENSQDSYSEFPSMNFCNLYLEKIFNQGKHNEHTEYKWICFSSFKNAINYIILKRLENKTYKGIGDSGLNLFLKDFKEERNRIITLFDKTEQEWLNILTPNKNSYTAIL